MTWCARYCRGSRSGRWREKAGKAEDRKSKDQEKQKLGKDDRSLLLLLLFLTLAFPSLWLSCLVLFLPFGLLYCGSMLKLVLEQGREAADVALEELLPPATQHPSSIHQAMRHSVFAGGKRLRPILCMEAGRMIRAGADAHSRARSHTQSNAAASSEKSSSAKLPYAASLPPGIAQVGAALEMLHTYSLIHDDLPALDNDDLRRGRPTCHKAFGEAIAILAGDALQTRVYEVLAQLICPAEARVEIIREIAHATGTVDGMIGGQVVDLEAEHKKPDLATLEYIHRSKTAALIAASVVSGGIYAGGSAGDIVRLRIYGQSIGLAFQIVDDVLDLTQTSEQLGKTAGKDAAAEKATYPALFGFEESIHRADALVDQACAELNEYGEGAATLKELARYLAARKS